MASLINIDVVIMDEHSMLIDEIGVIIKISLCLFVMGFVAGIALLLFLFVLFLLAAAGP